MSSNVSKSDINDTRRKASVEKARVTHRHDSHSSSVTFQQVASAGGFERASAAVVRTRAIDVRTVLVAAAERGFEVRKPDAQFVQCSWIDVPNAFPQRLVLGAVREKTQLFLVNQLLVDQAHQVLVVLVAAPETGLSLAEIEQHEDAGALHDAEDLPAVLQQPADTVGHGFDRGVQTAFEIVDDQRVEAQVLNCSAGSVRRWHRYFTFGQEIFQCQTVGNEPVLCQPRLRWPCDGEITALVIDAVQIVVVIDVSGLQFVGRNASSGEGNEIMVASALVTVLPAFVIVVDIDQRSGHVFVVTQRCQRVFGVFAVRHRLRLRRL